MTDSASGSSHDSPWGSFTPVMPAFIRLLAGVIVLVVLEAVVLGFPGVGQSISGTQFSIASLAVFIIGLVVTFIVLKFGTQISTTVHDNFKAYRAWTPVLAYFFQILAIVILYSVSAGIASPYFASAPWAYPLIFLLLALIPTLKVVTSVVHALEGQQTHKPSQN